MIWQKWTLKFIGANSLNLIWGFGNYFLENPKLNIFVEEINFIRFFLFVLHLQNLQGFHWMDPSVHSLSSEPLDVDEVKPKPSKSKCPIQ